MTDQEMSTALPLDSDPIVVEDPLPEEPEPEEPDDGSPDEDEDIDPEAEQ